MSLNLSIPRISTLAVSAGIALTAIAVTGSAPASPVQRASRTCTPPKYPGQGYFTGKIHVTNVTCTYGKRFVVAYYRCRTKKGRSPAGRCTTKVQRFTCRETRESIPTEIDAKVSCRRGTQRIVHTYQQNIE